MCDTLYEELISLYLSPIMINHFSRKIAVAWKTSQFHIREIQTLDLGPETVHPEYFLRCNIKISEVVYQTSHHHYQ